MTKLFNILTVILLVAFIFTVFTSVAKADGKHYSSQVDGLFEGGNVETGGITNVGANLVSIITTIGIIVAVIVLLIIGIKYMMGSASEKAEYKKTMIPYLVGALIIFGASAIAKAVIAMTSSITAGGN